MFEPVAADFYPRDKAVNEEECLPTEMQSTKAKITRSFILEEQLLQPV